jgi:CHAT domain-containing protein/Tfp pilus assembly protein PilF
VHISFTPWPARLAALALLLIVGVGAAFAQAAGPGDQGDRLDSLRAEGRYSEAITALKRAIAAQEAKSGLENPVGVVLLNNLGEFHYKLGLHAEAIPIYERALAISEKTIKADNPLTATLLRNLGIAYQLQGRHAEAARLYARSIAQFEKFLPATRIQLASTLNNQATLLQDMGRAKEAEQALGRVLKIYLEGLPAGHPYISTALNNLGFLYQRQGDIAKAEVLLLAALGNIDKSLPADHPQRAPLLANLGRLYAEKKDLRKAVDVLTQALDVYSSQARRGAASLDSELSGLPATDMASHKAAIAAYVYAATNLVVRDQSLGSRGIDIVGRLLDVAQQQPSATSVSLAQMSARRIKGDGPLAGLVRERQDLAIEWQARNRQMFERLIKVTAASASKDHLADRTRLAEIDRRIGELDRAIARDFPEYAALTNPQPLDLGQVHALLRDNEALVTFIETPTQVWTWVISKADKGLTLFNIGSDALAEQVAALRCGLDGSDWIDPADWPAATPADAHRKRQQEKRLQRCRRLFPGGTASATLPFDARHAHKLYRMLLGNVEKEIAGKRLLIVPSASLTQLPFNALVTELPDFQVPRDVADYRRVKWLGARQAITVLPSVASLSVLRRQVRPTRASKPWIGFGNPLLDGPPGDAAQRQRAADARARQGCGAGAKAERGAARGARAGIGDLVRGTRADVAVLRQQPPLPETADELCDVAKRLGVTEADVWLGARATEAAIKKLSAQGLLDDYASLHFATHGLVAGESTAILKAAAEPALMLTPPATASEEDDGLLTASEVAQLRLDADWIVLSACNTAAGGAEGAEALSGLARAFFYAGARSLLVSHWEVDSYAAVALTTRAFAETQKDRRIGRAEALRRSMLALIADPSDARNAHPSVWAPFVLVGEDAL